jgi:hypothetical protein
MFNILFRNISDLKDKYQDKYDLDLSIIITLCIVAQQSFVIKVLGLGILTLLNLSSLKKINLFKIPLFYSIIPFLELIKFFINRDFSLGHISIFSVGLVYWIASIIICWIIFDRVNFGQLKAITRSLKLFVLINFIISIFQYIKICIDEGVINPYNTGHHHPYGVSSGDMITGLLQGVHLTNVFVNLILILFFVHQRNFIFLLLSLIPFLLCGSNFGTMVLLFSLFIYFLISFNKKHLFTTSFGIFAIILCFYWLVTPYNALHTYSKLKSIITHRPVVDEEYQQKVDQETTIAYRNKKLKGAYINESELAAMKRLEMRKGLVIYDFFSEAGKKTSYKQTMHFLKSSHTHLFWGTGIGGFSSNIAFNFSGIVDNSTMNRLFPEYESAYFANNHKSIYAYLKTTHVIFHSESNKPFSVYNQLLGEYGLIGFCTFLFFYILYFLKRVNKRNYAIPVIIAVLFALNLNYFIESLNLLLFFELLMFINIKENIVAERV